MPEQRNVRSFVFGSQERALDSRYRITLTRDFEEIFPHSDPPMACYWWDYSIALMPESVYRDFMSKLMATTRTAKDQALRNFFLANTARLSVDQNHRITLRKQDLDYMRQGNPPHALPNPNDPDSEWKEDLTLSGLFDYIVVKTSASAEKTKFLGPELMGDYKNFLETVSSAMHGTTESPTCNAEEQA